MPLVGLVRVVIIRTVVVLPAPLGPSRPSTEPSGTTKRDAVDGDGVAEVLDEVLGLDGVASLSWITTLADHPTGRVRFSVGDPTPETVTCRSRARCPPSPGPAVEIDGLVMRYGDKVAVDGLSLRVERGSITAVLGPNGAGKTTTLETCEGYRRAAGRHRPGARARPARASVATCSPASA